MGQGWRRVWRRGQRWVFVLVLAVPCAAESVHDSRNLHLRVLPDGGFWLNDYSYDENAVRLHVFEAMQYRSEKETWIAGDEGISFQEMVSEISKLKRDTPDLSIAVVTKSQTVPLEPIGAVGPARNAVINDVIREQFVPLWLSMTPGRIGE